MKAPPKFKTNDLVSFKFSSNYRDLYSGVIVSIWHHSKHKVVYEIASMNHSMCSYSISEDCIVKKLS